MIRKCWEFASQVICVTALAILATEPDGDAQKRKRQVLAHVRDFEGYVQSSSFRAPQIVADVFFSESVLKWLVDLLIATAPSYGVTEQMPVSSALTTREG